MTELDENTQELGQLRDILLAPMEQRNKQRDEKILDFVEDLAKSLNSRINELEQRIEQLGIDAEEDRRQVVDNMADTMASLGQQLRAINNRQPDEYDRPARFDETG